MKYIYRSIITVILALSAGKALAHVPYFEKEDSTFNQPFQINTGTSQSIAIYASIEGPDDVDYFSFSVEKTDFDTDSINVHVGMLVPRCSDHRNFYPEIVLYGPTELSTSVHELQGFRMSPDRDIDRDETAWYEKFSGTWYWWSQKTDLKISLPGTYLIEIYDPKQIKGDYVLEFGDEESWGPSDIFRATKAMLILRQHKEISSIQCREEVGSFDSYNADDVQQD